MRIPKEQNFIFRILEMRTLVFDSQIDSNLWTFQASHRSSGIECTCVDAPPQRRSNGPASTCAKRWTLLAIPRSEVGFSQVLWGNDSPFHCQKCKKGGHCPSFMLKKNMLSLKPPTSRSQRNLRVILISASALKPSTPPCNRGFDRIGSVDHCGWS